MRTRIVQSHGASMDGLSLSLSSPSTVQLTRGEKTIRIALDDLEVIRLAFFLCVKRLRQTSKVYLRSLGPPKTCPILINILISHLQARKISPVFQLQASSLYLVKEFENVAVFPHETSGRFNRSLIDPTAVYMVHGDDLCHGHGSDTGTPSSSSTPFGAYTGLTQNLSPPRSQLS